MKLAGDYVLDSFAMLSYLGGEPGAPDVRAVLEHCETGAGSGFMSLVNLGECLYIVEREAGIAAARATVAAVDQLPIEIVPADRARAFAAAHIKASHRVSFADAFAIALAVEKAATVVTGDPEFQAVATKVGVLWLRR